MKNNSDLRTEARAVLSENWLMGAVAALLFSAICGGMAAIPFVGGVAFLFVMPVTYGFSITMLHLYRQKQIDLGLLFEGFSDYGRILGTKILQIIYQFLWTLLLIIPGIIKFYSYAMVDYILKDEPEIRNNAAIEKSMAMMDGHKMKLFLLHLSFIGWAILCVFTLGIGYFFLQAYMGASNAAFYEDLKKEMQPVTE